MLDIMKTNVITCLGSETVYSAACLMTKHNVGCVVICENKKPIGIVTDKDLLKKVICKNMPLGTKVQEVMNKPVITATSLDAIVKVAKIMEKNNIKRVPIVDPLNGELVGIVTAKDLVGPEADMITVLREYIEAQK